MSRHSWEQPVQAARPPRRQPSPAGLWRTSLRPATELLNSSLSIYYQAQESGSLQSVKLGTNVEEV